MAHHSGNKAIVKSLIWTPFHHSICVCHWLSASPAILLWIAQSCSIKYSPPHITPPCDQSLQCTERTGRKSRRACASQSSAWLPHKKPPPRHKLCAKQCWCYTSPVCKLHYGLVMEARLCNSMRSRVQCRGCFDARSCHKHSLHPLPVSLTYTYFHSQRLTQISRSHTFTTLLQPTTVY